MRRLKPGQEVRYRSSAGDHYDAVVRHVLEDGTVGIDVTCSARVGDIMFLSMVAVDEKRRMACWPKESK